MGRRRGKKGSGEIAAVLFGLALFYAFATGHRAQLVRLTFWLAVIGAIVFVVVAITRNRRQPESHLSRRSQPTTQRPYTPRPNPVPASDVLDQARKTPTVSKPTPSPKTVEEVAKPTEWSLQLIRDIEWKRFEELCQGYWTAKDYRAELTCIGADGGIDIQLYRPSNPDKIMAVIQCKSWTSEKVGVQTVRELFGVMTHMKAPMGILMTSSDFHTPAREFAAEKHLKLINGAEVLQLVLSLPVERQQALLAHVTRGDYLTPTCSRCDVKMRRVQSGGSWFFGCTNYPRCHNTLRPRRTN